MSGNNEHDASTTAVECGACGSDVDVGMCCRRAMRVVIDDLRAQAEADRAALAARGEWLGRIAEAVGYPANAEPADVLGKIDDMRDRAEVGDEHAAHADTFAKLHAIAEDLLRLQNTQLARMAPVVEAAEAVRDDADFRYPELGRAVDAYRAGTPAPTRINVPALSAAMRGEVYRPPPRLTVDEARAIVEAGEWREDDALYFDDSATCAAETNGPIARAWDSLVAEARAMVAECKEVP